MLQLRNNIIKRIEPVMFKDLDRLEVLDLGGNKISSIVAGSILIPIIFQILYSKFGLFHMVVFISHEFFMKL